MTVIMIIIIIMIITVVVRIRVVIAVTAMIAIAGVVPGNADLLVRYADYATAAAGPLEARVLQGHRRSFHHV